MDGEPRGHAIDGTPWEEPRPPHLPDRLTSISLWVLPFLVVAVVQLWVFWRDQPFGTDASSLLEYWLGIRYEFVGIAGSLIGVGLFLRHPDARTALPQIATGAFLLLLTQILGLLESTLEPVFATFAPGSDEFSFFSPLSQAYRIFTSLVGVFGIAFIASGLSGARRYEDVRSMRGPAILLTGLAIVNAGYTTLGYALVQDYVEGISLVFVVGALLANLFRALALSYLVVVSVSGWLAQEAPRSGWRLAAVGGGLLLFHALAAPFLGLVPLPQEALLTIFGFMADGVIVGWVLVVVAFAVGLPSTESTPEDEVAGATLDRPAVTTPDFGAG